MNKHAIYHITEAPYAYGINKETLIVRIRTAKNDLEKCEIYYKDRYDWKKPYKVKKMRLVEVSGLFEFYEVEIKVEENRFRYLFKLQDKEENILYFNEKGILTELLEPVEEGAFQFPFLNEIDVHKGLKWAEGGIVYQIMPDRFFNGDKSNDPINTLPWGEKVTPKSMFGGDLQGIIEKMDYIESLGVTIIYLTPIFLSSTNHKYNTKDYYKVDNTFGDVNKAKELVTRAHDKGIKIIFDAVFNHSGDDFFAFEDVCQKGEKSKYKDWFHIKSFPINKKNVNYLTFANDVYIMPKLNTENLEVREYLLDVAQYWIKEVGIDGWRLDVCDEVDHSFWRDFRKAVKEVNPEAIIVGEIMHEATSWLKGDQFDSIMNYPFKNLCIDFFAKRSITAEVFDSQLAINRATYMKQINRLLFNLIDSHDTARFLTEANEKEERMKLAAVFQFTYIGIPYIYYGDEIGMKGENDPYCRACMIWEDDEQDIEMLSLYKKLSKIRKKEKALICGEYINISNKDDVLIFKRVFENEQILIILNNSENTNVLQLNMKVQRYVDLVSGDSGTINGDFIVKPNEYRIIKLK